MGGPPEYYREDDDGWPDTGELEYPYWAGRDSFLREYQRVPQRMPLPRQRPASMRPLPRWQWAAGIIAGVAIVLLLIL